MRWAIVWFTMLGTACVVHAQSPRAGGRERGDYQRTLLSPAENDPVSDREAFPGGYGRPADVLPGDPYPAFDVNSSGQPSFIPAAQTETSPPAMSSQPPRENFGPGGNPLSPPTSWPRDASRSYPDEPPTTRFDQSPATGTIERPSRQRGDRPAGAPLMDAIPQANPTTIVAPPSSEQPTNRLSTGNQEATTGREFWPDRLDTRRTEDEPGGELRAPRQEYSLTVLLLFGSIGLNIYLFWITWDTYNRYQDLLGDLRSSRNRRDSEMLVA